MKMKELESQGNPQAFHMGARRGIYRAQDKKQKTQCKWGPQKLHKVSEKERRNCISKALKDFLSCRGPSAQKVGWVTRWLTRYTMKNDRTDHIVLVEFLGCVSSCHTALLVLFLGKLWHLLVNEGENPDFGIWKKRSLVPVQCKWLPRGPDPLPGGDHRSLRFHGHMQIQLPMTTVLSRILEPWK